MILPPLQWLARLETFQLAKPFNFVVATLELCACASTLQYEYKM
jgi:hypothetical protein